MICDAHNDIITCVENEDLIIDYLQSCKMLGIEVITLAVWTTKNKRVEELLTIAKQLCASVLPSNVLAIEDLGFLDVGHIEHLKELKPAYASLTWNYKNRYASGALDSGGLTAMGKEAIDELGKANIALDLAHLNRKSFFDALDCAQGRVLCSHTCFDDIKRHPRNLTKEQIKALLERGGFVGLTLVPDFLCNGFCKIDDVVRHIDYFVQQFGCEGLGIGSDFFGAVTHPAGLEGYAGFDVLEAQLIKRGYDRDCVNAILGDNYMRFLRGCGFKGSKL